MESFLEALSADLLQAALVITVAVVVRLVVSLAIRRVKKVLLSRPPKQVEQLSERARALLGRDLALLGARHEQRVRTLASLLRNVADTVIIVIVVLTLLAIFGVPMGPLLASAGIGGVAIGFGAQSLVKDYLSGIFMLAEDQFGIGDLITVGDITGTVQEVTLRVTKVRDSSGTIWYVRNGEILQLGNKSQSSTVSYVEVLVAPDADAEQAIEVVREALAGMQDEEQYRDVITAEPSVLGVGRVDASSMALQVMLTTVPNEQWAPLRDVRVRAQRALTRAGVPGPKLPGHQA